MANLYSQYESGAQLTAGAIVGSSSGVSGLNPVVDRLNSIASSDNLVTGSMISGASTVIYASGGNVFQNEVWLTFIGDSATDFLSTLQGYPLHIPLVTKAVGSGTAANTAAGTSWMVPDNYTNIISAELYGFNEEGNTTGSLLMWWGIFRDGTKWINTPITIGSTTIPYTSNIGSVFKLDVTNIINSGLNAGSGTAWGVRTYGDAQGYSFYLPGMRIKYI